MCKILIAEDEVWISALIRSIIEKNCPNSKIIGEASNGRRALELIDELKPDIVLADINMPILSGLQVIEEAKKNGFGGKFVIISGYKDFSYVQQALRMGVEDYLLKPVDDDKLCAVINRVANKIVAETSVTQKNTRNDALLKAQFLNRLLADSSPSLASCNEAFGLHFEPTRFCCAIIRFIHRALDHSYLISESLSQVTNRFRLEFEKQIVPLCSEAFFLPQGSYFILFLNFPVDQIHTVHDTLFALIDGLADYCSLHSIRPRVGLSELCSDFSLLPIAYRQAQAAIASRAATGQERITVFSRDQSNRTNSPAPFSLSDRDLTALNRAIRSPSPNELIGWFNHLFDDYMRQHNICESETFLMIDVVISLMTALTDLLRNLPTPIELERTVYRDHYTTTQDLRDHLTKILTEAKDKIDQQLNATDVTISKVSEYINVHLADPITLEEVSRAVYLTPSYLSEYFKSKTGTNFKDYVLQRRMERATDLLRQSNTRIQDIALQCGYTDFKHFCKVFKKSIGVTPTEFRRIYG